MYESYVVSVTCLLLASIDYLTRVYHELVCGTVGRTTISTRYFGRVESSAAAFFTTTTKNMKVIATTLLGLAASANAVSLTPDVSISTDGYCCER